MRYNEQINLKLYTYSNNTFTLQAIIDDYQEISFSHNLYEAGDFTITINYNIPNALKFERGMFIQFGNDPYMFGEILTISDSIGEDGKGSQQRTITGKDARFIFKRRIIKNLNNEENWAMTNKGEICLRELVKAQCGSSAEAKRQLPVTNIIPESASAIGKEYSVAEAFSNLYDTLVTIATQSEIGWRIKFDGTLTLEVFEGTDLSSQVQFSTDYDSLSNGEFTDSSESFANTIYVGGKGTGSDRDIYEGEVETEGATPEGMDRFEAWDNQSSMTSESEYEAEAFSMLTQYGQTLNIAGQGLAKCPYIFKEQYNIGDTTTLAFSGKSAKAQILSVTEHWIWGQYGIEFSFGKPQNNLDRQLQLILKQIQKASNKTTTTSSVKYYTIPTDTSQPKADVIYDRIGFVGTCASGGSTFTLYYDSEKTGAKTYHVYFKQLGGGNLTLTTGVSGKSNLVLNSGTYVAIVYVDQEGNVLSQGATPTNTIASGNVQPAQSGAVADSINKVVSNFSDLPTDAVLHYSFDEVPDYPDGSADVRLLNNNTYDIQSTNYQLRNNYGTTFSNVDGNVRADTTVSASLGGTYGFYFHNSYINNKIIKIKFEILSLSEGATIKISNGWVSQSESQTVAVYTKTGTYEICLINNPTSTVKNLYFFTPQPNATSAILIKQIYIGNGSYNTPIIDNANGQNNATNNGGIAVQGVSGKGAYFSSANQQIEVPFKMPTSNDNLTISLWLKIPLSYKYSGEGSVKAIFATGAYAGLFGFYRQGNEIGFITRDSTNARQFGFTPDKDIWLSLVAVYNGATHSFTLYCNGIQKAVSESNLADYQFGSGKWDLWGNARRGGTSVTLTDQPAYIDDLLIFNRALSEQEVVALYLNKANTPKYYDLNNYKLPTPPSADGTYTLKVSVTSGVQTYQWV